MPHTRVSSTAEGKMDRSCLFPAVQLQLNDIKRTAMASSGRTTATLHLDFTCTVCKHHNKLHPQRTIFKPSGLQSCTSCTETQHFTNIKPS